ncbi:uridine kinase [Bdellovibrio bacteriovorus]|uniref:uridine/cytidine kinase n=1 Tax=Bdellovibrio bacteriovorus TaxID=959 RepID=A0A1Z3N9D7_BDEBC|nr:uridine kinase [Bdellovibrio bacteriovorus]ASD64088.1 uridine kinase [Bdellovibrio bacteriovorus]
MSRPHIIGVAGGSGSGKTYFAKELQKMLGSENCSILYQDNYYIDQSARFDGDGGSVNFDHPQALDFTLLARGLQTLKMGQPLHVPIYDFVTHSRKSETLLERPKRVIIVDGILILHSQEVRAELDEAVFFDTPEDLRFQRRLHRDVHERGRTPEGVKKQFELQVRPMHDEFVEPSKRHAQTIVTDCGDYHAVLSRISQRLQNTLPVR